MFVKCFEVEIGQMSAKPGLQKLDVSCGGKGCDE